MMLHAHIRESENATQDVLFFFEETEVRTREGSVVYRAV